MGRIPPLFSTTLLIEDFLTGRVCSTELSQVFADALFKDDSDQALRPKDPTTLLAYAEAAQHGMREGAPTTTEVKNRMGCGLWTEFIREVRGDSSPLRRPDPLLLCERLLKNMYLLWCRTKCVSSLRGRITCKPESLLGHLYAAKREHEKHKITFLPKGMTHQLNL
jgi:hypothetical protein